jgi:hypothetical protein
MLQKVQPPLSRARSMVTNVGRMQLEDGCATSAPVTAVMKYKTGEGRSNRRPLAAWAAVTVGMVAAVVPPLATILISVMLGFTNIPKSSMLIVGLTVGTAAMTWCFLASHWWRQWVGTLHGLDHVAVERLALRAGLIWGKL